MTTGITDSQIDADREREIEKARAEVLRRAEEQGIKPFTSFEDLTADSEMIADFDVDEFLAASTPKTAIDPLPGV